MTTRGKRISLAFLNLIGFIGTVMVNGLANALPIGGVTTGALSDMYPNLFVPAGFTFSIWGLIYLLLGLFIVYQLIVALGRNEDRSAFIQRIGVFFFIASAANIGWIFAWHYQYVGISLILMVLLLVSLIAVYLRLDIRKRGFNWRERFFIAAPFSIYLGWITVATVANVTALLVDIGWNGFGLSDVVWTCIVIGIATIIALFMLFTRQDILYCLVVEWAFFGILMKRIRVDAVLKTGIIVTLAVCMALLLFDMGFQAARKKVY